MDAKTDGARSFLEQHLSIERVPTILAASSATLYILGFIVATSFYVSRGINDPVLLSPRYIMAGALVALTLLGYYFFVGRRLLTFGRRTVEEPPRFGPKFRGFLQAYDFLEVIGACCGAAAWIGGLLISDISALPAQIVFVIAYLLDAALFRSVIRDRYPRTVYGLSALVQFVAISIFYIYCAINLSLLYLLAEYIGFTLVGIMVFTSPSWRSGDRSYGIFTIALIGLLGVINFGATVYENISPKFGGAEPPRIEILLAADASEELKNTIMNSSSDLYLLLEADSSITVRLGREKNSRSLRMDKKFVSGVIFTRHEPKKLNLPPYLEPIRFLMEKSSA